MHFTDCAISVSSGLFLIQSSAVLMPAAGAEPSDVASHLFVSHRLMSRSRPRRDNQQVAGRSTGFHPEVRRVSGLK